MEILKIRHDGWELDLAPGLGGAIVRCRWQCSNGRWVDVLRPTADGTCHVLNASCFLLTPFSNRVRDGIFTFAGVRHRLPVNGPGPHPLHGAGWQRPWQVVEAGPAHAVLSYCHKPDSWPYPYCIEQRFELRNGRLVVALTARNTGTRAMPFGFGLHPYFPRTARCTLTAQVAGQWLTDADILPTGHVAPAPASDPTSGLMIATSDLDTVFTGWSGDAEIHWPERQLRLGLRASQNLRFLVVYTPPGADFFCVEPVSNCTDAFNLAGNRHVDTGMIVLEPGQQVCGWVEFAPMPE